MQDEVTLSVGDARIPVKEGLKNGGHVYLSCSNCQAGLLDVWITRPGELDPMTKEPAAWKVKASCPFCGDESFQEVINGGFHPAGYGIPRPDSPVEDVIPSTRIDRFDIVNGVIVFKMVKDNKDAKPIRVRR